MRSASPPRAITAGLLAFLVVGLPLAANAAHNGSLHAIPIPYPEAGDDELALVARTWRVVEAPDPSFIDFEGAADDPANGTFAFRLLTDIAAFEGALAAGEQNRSVPLGNIGIRWHAVTFDPPIRFDDERTLRRVIPGALNWTAVHTSTPLAGDDPTVMTFWTSIPIPTNGTIAPDTETSEAGHIADPDAVAWLVWWASFADEPRLDADVGVRSPALVRYGGGVLIDQAAAQTRIFDSRVIFTWHHDFVTVGTGVSAEPQGELNATGLYVQRTTAYTVNRVFDTAHRWGNNTTTLGPRVPALTTFAVPPFGRLPTSEPTSLFSPVTFNTTVGMRPVPVNTTTWRFGDGPAVTQDGHGVLVGGELGFLADGPLLVPPNDDNDPDDEPGDANDNTTERGSPAAGTVWVVFVFVGYAAFVARRRTS